MPLIRIDYDSEVLDDNAMAAFTDFLLSTSMEVFETDEDHISIFTSSFSKYDRSTAIAEIEYRAGKKEFVSETQSAEEMREDYLKQLTEAINGYKNSKKISGGMIVSVTIEDWKVEWLA